MIDKGPPSGFHKRATTDANEERSTKFSAGLELSASCPQYLSINDHLLGLSNEFRGQSCSIRKNEIAAELSD